MRLYAEGGNLFRINNRYNFPQCVVGEDLALATLHSLYSEGWFDPPDPASRIFQEEENVYSKRGDPLSTLFLEGKIPQIIEEIAPSFSFLTLKEVEDALVEIIRNEKALTKSSDDKRSTSQNPHRSHRRKNNSYALYGYDGIYKKQTLSN